MAVSQVWIGITRLLQIEAPEKGAEDQCLWITALVSAGTVWALRHTQAPEEGNADFEHWLKVNFPGITPLDVARVWFTIGIVKKSQALRIKPSTSGS